MKILIAEDEKDLVNAVKTVLTYSGYEVDTAGDGEEAVALARKNAYDAMIFDIMMPRMDGVTALRTLRSQGITVPVMFLTAKAELDDRVEGLDAGADDYLPKPFAMKELLARLRSLTRRSGQYTPGKLSYGSVTLDTAQQEIVSENAIRLAGKETRLMEYFMRNPARPLSTQELYAQFWADEEAPEDVVYVYVSYLRSKLRAIGANITITGESGGAYALQEISA